MSVGNMPAYFFPIEVCRRADTRLTADLGNSRAFFALLNDERLLRVREL
jgi:hypothetical protein